MALAWSMVGVDLVARRTSAPRLPQHYSGLSVPAGLAFGLMGSQATSFGGALIVDRFSVFFNLLFLAAAAIVVLIVAALHRPELAWSGGVSSMLSCFSHARHDLNGRRGRSDNALHRPRDGQYALYILAGFRKRDRCLQRGSPEVHAAGRASPRPSCSMAWRCCMG